MMRPPKIFDNDFPGSDIPAFRYVPVTKSASDLPDGQCRGLLVGEAGSANLTDPEGVDRDDVPLQQGYNPLRAIKVREGGDADNIWALY